MTIDGEVRARERTRSSPTKQKAPRTMNTRIDVPILRSFSNIRAAAVAWAVLAMAVCDARGQVIYDANFNTQPLGPLAAGSAPILPTSVFAGGDAAVNVVASAGNLT